MLVIPFDFHNGRSMPRTPVVPTICGSDDNIRMSATSYALRLSTFDVPPPVIVPDGAVALYVNGSEITTAT